MSLPSQFQSQNPKLKMTQTQIDHKEKQLAMNKQAAQKLLLSLRAQLSGSTVSSITLSGAK